MGLPIPQKKKQPIDFLQRSANNELQRKHNIFFKHFPLMMISLVVIIALFLFALLYNSDSCGDNQCFIEKANNCETATITTSIQEIELSHKVENCIYMRKITKLPKDEIDEVKEL